LPFCLTYHSDVAGDLSSINQNIKKRIGRAIKTRLAVSPSDYGKPLRKNLKGYWKMRVGDYRVIYKIKKKEVLILAVIHRKKVYKESAKRKE